MGLYSYQVNLTFKMRLYTECQVHLTRAVCYFRHDKSLNMRQYTEYQVNLTFKMRLYFPPRFSKLYIPDPLVLFTLVAYEISHQKEVNPNQREIINKFEMSMMKLHKKICCPHYSKTSHCFWASLWILWNVRKNIEKEDGPDSGGNSLQIWQFHYGPQL